MARRDSKPADAATEAPEEAAEAAAEETTEAEEAEATEAEAAEVETGEQESGTEGGESKPAEPAKEVDLGPFTAAAASAAALRDTNTGTLPEGALEPVLVQYRALPDTKARNKAKAALKDAMTEAMKGGDLSLGFAYLTMQDNMTTAGAKSGERKPADPTAAWKSNLLTALLAYGELYNNPPEGVDADEVVGTAGEFTDQMSAWKAYLDAPEPEEGSDAPEPEKPEVPAEVVAAFRLVRGGKIKGAARSGGGSSHDGPRRDLGKHIAEAFAEVEDGKFLSVADIKKHKSSEYPDEPPSAGAISARLFPKTGSCTVAGIEPGVGGDKNTKGAYKRSA